MRSRHRLRPPANAPHEPRCDIMRGAEHLGEIGIHAGPAQERDIREGLAQERAKRERQRPFYSSHRPRSAKKLTLAPTKDSHCTGSNTSIAAS